MYADTVQEQVVRNLLPRATLVKVEGDAFDVDVVAEGRVHAALVGTFAPQALVGRAPETLFLPLAEPLQTARTAMAARKGDPDFVNYLNSWLAFQTSTGWIEARTKHWSDLQNWPR